MMSNKTVLYIFIQSIFGSARFVKIFQNKSFFTQKIEFDGETIVMNQRNNQFISF